MYAVLCSNAVNAIIYLSLKQIKHLKLPELGNENEGVPSFSQQAYLPLHASKCHAWQSFDFCFSNRTVYTPAKLV